MFRSSNPRLAVPSAPLVARHATAALLVLLPALCGSQEILNARELTVNGRPVQEIRFGDEPNGNLLRAVVLTNGPTAGTTTVLTAVAPLSAWTDPGQPAPVFTEILPSATAFSVGGGCTRGNQVDFPIIDNARPKVLRFIGGTLTQVPVLPLDTEPYDSGNCVVSNDATRTFFIFSNRVRNRLSFQIDRGGPNDLNGVVVNFPDVKTPFAGGLRPQISTQDNRPDSISLLYMAVNGQSRFIDYDALNLNIDRNCLVGTQSPAPTAFTIPRGAQLGGNDVLGDFDGDGTFEYARIGNAPACSSQPPAQTPAGLVAGNGFSWTEPGIALTVVSQNLQFLLGQQFTVRPDGTTSTAPGVAPGDAGPFAACPTEHPGNFDGMVVAFVRQVHRIRVASARLGPSAPQPNGRFYAGFEALEFGAVPRCGFRSRRPPA